MATKCEVFDVFGWFIPEASSRIIDLLLYAGCYFMGRRNKKPPKKRIPLEIRGEYVGPPCQFRAELHKTGHSQSGLAVG